MSTSTSSTTKPRHFGLLLFPQFELLDMAGPMEVLNDLARHPTHGDYDIKLTTISAQPGPVSTISSPPNLPGALFSQTFVATTSLASARNLDLDVLIIPGGYGAEANLAPDFKTPNTELDQYIEFVRDIFPRLQYIFTICNGAGVAARAGVLDGKRATTNKTLWKVTTKLGPKTHWVGKARWVEDGKCWTTSGVSAGIDGMVAFVAKLWGDDTAEVICKEMEYVRRRDEGDDPFAAGAEAEDVLPVV